MEMPRSILVQKALCQEFPLHMWVERISHSSRVSSFMCLKMCVCVCVTDCSTHPLSSLLPIFINFTYLCVVLGLAPRTVNDQTNEICMRWWCSPAFFLYWRHFSTIRTSWASNSRVRSQEEHTEWHTEGNILYLTVWDSLQTLRGKTDSVSQSY